MTENGSNNWISALEPITHAYNNSYHRSIAMTPKEASLRQNRTTVFNRLYPKHYEKPRCRFKVGQKIRLPVKRNVFSKSYDVGWTEEIYEIAKITKVDYIKKSYNLNY